jgi:phage major head subunit gpT-like protein
MAVGTRSLHPSELWPGVKAFFGKTYKELPKQYSQVFETLTSDKAYEEIVETTGYGLAVQKNEGQAVTYDLDGEGYKSRLTHVVYALGWMVSREAIDDNQYKAQANRRSEMLAFSMRQTAEQVHANIFNRAFTSGYTGGDGALLCSTAHPTSSGNQANTPTVAVDLNEASLEDELVELKLMKNNRGLRINVMPKRLIVPPQLMFVAQRLLKSTGQSGTANNDLNAIKSMGYFSEGAFVYDYLTDTDAWFIQTDVDKSLIRYQRDGMELSQDNDFDTENAKAKARERYIAGWADWRGLRGSPGI